MLNIFKNSRDENPETDDRVQKLLDKILYKFPNNKDYLTYRDAIEGFIGFGATGSGKTSGMARGYLKSILAEQMGGMACAVKQEAGKEFKKLAKKMGREVIHFCNGSPYSFSPVNYELTREGDGAREINNITQLFITLGLQVNNYKIGGGSGKSEDRFWQQGMERLINRAVTLLLLAKVEVTVFSIRKIIIHSFSEEDVNRFNHLWTLILDQNITEEQNNQVKYEYQEWLSGNFFLETFHTANSREDLDEDELFEMELVGDYFLKEWPKLAEKTKSIILETFLGTVEPFFSGILKRHFSKGVSEELLPENTYKKGTIILVDFSVKEFELQAILANTLMKFAFQKAMERRKISEETGEVKPTFLFLDEYQCLCNPNYDPTFQSTARESLVITAYITQSKSAIQAVMGSESPEARTNALLANLGTKCFCANSDYDTNLYASNMIGKQFIDIRSTTINHDKTANHSYNQQYHYKVPPEFFLTMLTGGKRYNYKVQSILVKAGKQWSTGDTFLLEEFKQEII